MTVETIPILPSADFDSTGAFYSKLGFDEVARFPDEYLVIRHPIGMELHFWHKRQIHPATNDAACYVRFDSAQQARDLHDAWSSLDLGDGEIRPLEDAGYNLLEFAVLDQYRNLLRIGGIIQ